MYRYGPLSTSSNSDTANWDHVSDCTSVWSAGDDVDAGDDVNEDDVNYCADDDDGGEDAYSSTQLSLDTSISSLLSQISDNDDDGDCDGDELDEDGDASSLWEVTKLSLGGMSSLLEVTRSQKSDNDGFSDCDGYEDDEDSFYDGDGCGAGVDKDGDAAAAADDDDDDDSDIDDDNRLCCEPTMAYNVRTGTVYRLTNTRHCMIIDMH